MLSLPIYLDYNATTPCDPRVLEAMLPFFTRNFGNAASRNHSFGWIADEAVKHARENVARLVGAEPEEIIFTSGATEANNLALRGAFEMYSGKGNHIITSKIEHKAVLDPCHDLEKQGASVTYLDVKKDGLVDPGDLEKELTTNTILVAIMHANNEIGTLMPVQPISELAKKRSVLFFTDATQAVGKIPVDVQRDGIDLMAFSAHKMYGPKGVGALYVRRKNPRVKLTPQITGGGHEKGLRSGTLNVPGIVGFGKAAEICMQEMQADAQRIGALRDQLEAGLLRIEGTKVNGSIEHRLPHVTNLSFANSEGEALIMSLSKNIAVSTGSACMSATMEPSYVLKALGLSDENARSSLRFSLGRYTTSEEVAYTIEQVKTSVDKLTKENIVN